MFADSKAFNLRRIESNSEASMLLVMLEERNDRKIQRWIGQSQRDGCLHSTFAKCCADQPESEIKT
jgi:hypothetical protein